METKTKKPKDARWDGGHIHIQEDGTPLFIIEKRVAKRRFHISTRCHTATAAHEHLKRFQADPWEYEREMREGRASSEQLALTMELVLRFRDWLLKREKPTTRRHANTMAHRLGDWMDDLKGRDLRRLELKQLHAALDARATCRQRRVIAIKTFMAWLREKEFLLERKDDATLDLKVPQGSPEKHRRTKAVPVKHVRKALAQLDRNTRDAILLRAHTGWHISELERFILDKHSSIAPGKGKVLAVLQTRHKGGATTRTPLRAAVALQAAKRLRSYGAMPRRWNRKLRAACKAAGVPFFEAGQIRHSVATWAIERGDNPETVAEFLGHKDKRTTLKFYADVAVPTVSVSLPKL